jgi:orotidine-5'-phosphate decarboxylase
MAGVIVALDVPTRQAALKLVGDLGPRVRLFKVGLELLMSAGPQVVPEIRELGVDVFVDGKFLDIPNTVAGAARAVTRLGARMFNVHGLGGAEMLKAAVNAAHDEAGRTSRTPPLVLAVTILTSIDQAVFQGELGFPGTIADQVCRLTELAVRCGLDGVVASPLEIRWIRSIAPPEFVVVTPGVRPRWAPAGDQRRAATPGDAVRDGATHVVVGRPILSPPESIGSPLEAADLVITEISEAEKHAGHIHARPR